MTILVYEDGHILVDHADPLECVDFNGLIACITNPKSGDVLTYKGGMLTNGKSPVYAVPANGADVTSLDTTTLSAGAIIDVTGIPTYVDNVSTYSEYELTETGWYVFVRIGAPDGVTVSESTEVTGADGYVATVGNAYVDVAVRFDVAAMSKQVSIDWGETEESYLFRATDLAIRNLDYRTTFYVYDADGFVTWEYALTTDETFVADKTYYKLSGSSYVKAYEDEKYALTADETFASGKTYYTKSDGKYTAATVTVGEAVTADTYYELASVTADTYYNHSKCIISGLARNITYKLDDVIDCPMEFILPEIEDETHGCWFEIRCIHAGEYSMTLTPPSADVKIATEHTQKETKGVNMIDLHYTYINGVKLWRFMNTHSSIPEAAATT